MNFRKGFTIIELIVVVIVMAVLMLSISSLLVSIFNGSNQSLLAMGNVNDATITASKFTNDLRNSTNGADGSYPLGLLGDTEIVFYSNAGGDTIPNRIHYYLSGTTLYRGVVVPTGSPLSYNLSSEVVRPVQTDVINGANPVFYYYDGSYSGTQNALTQPVNVNNVKYIKMTLTILKRTQANSNSSFSISAGASLRNLKTNLGD